MSFNNLSNQQFTSEDYEDARSMATVDDEFSVNATEKSQEQPAPKRRRCWALVHNYATESPVDTFTYNQGNCKAVFTGGITSNLLSHLKKKHQIDQRKGK